MRKSHVIRILNISRQTIPLQIRPPGGDFFLDEQQVRLFPGKCALLPKSHVIAEQVVNLQASRMVKVLYDSEVVEDRESIVG